MQSQDLPRLLDCLARIKEETMYPVDNHSAALISVHIQVLLEYPAHFSRMFKRIAGQSPSQFRAEMANER